ncbi:MAG: class I SAM-dependent methyltransferase [Planctomycetota bacterium]|jgi:2-polyprenyl-6-hydroxyphenyl methylase/3-demethylubiquinone-9 3-methyltransferase
MEPREGASPDENEIRQTPRFEFGRNWARFLRDIDEERVERAAVSLRTMLGTDSLEGRTFLDVGCGSGLFSLAARRLGAIVRSFDYDAESVACARELKRRFRPDDRDWAIETGSILDKDYLESLGRFDVVYCWGVVHHTGAMWEALANTADRVASGGMLFVAIYNDQGRASRRWFRVKRTYNRLPPSLRWAVLAPAFLRLWGPTFIRDTLKGRPLSTWRGYSAGPRAMSPWRDVVDWVGGYPFEVAKPGEVLDFCRQRGFAPKRTETVGGGLGCNEFIFVRATSVDDA